MVITKKMLTNVPKGYLDIGKYMKKRTSLRRFTFQFILGVIVGIAGFALTIMLLVKISFFANWGIGWILLFIVIGLFGFFLAKYAGWSKIR